MSLVMESLLPQPCNPKKLPMVLATICFCFYLHVLLLYWWHPNEVTIVWLHYITNKTVVLELQIQKNYIVLDTTVSSHSNGYSIAKSNSKQLNCYTPRGYFFLPQQCQKSFSSLQVQKCSYSSSNHKRGLHAPICITQIRVRVQFSILFMLEQCAVLIFINSAQHYLVIS